jgi:hypothetical protein
MELSMLRIKALTSELMLLAVPLSDPMARAFRLCFRNST